MKASIFCVLTFGLLLMTAPGVGLSAQQRPSSDAAGPVPRLVPTPHPALPATSSRFWMVPDAATRSAATRDANLVRLARGARLISAGDHAAGLPLVRGFETSSSPLSAYAQYYAAVALTGLGQTEEAIAILERLREQAPDGFLAEAIALQLAAAQLARRAPEDAVEVLDDLAGDNPSAPEEVLLRLGRAAESAGDTDRALETYRRLYYDYPLSPQSAEAQTGLARLETPALQSPNRFDLELARAEKLFAARRWAQSRAAFVALERAVTGERRDLITLRIAETDYYLDRHRAARTALVPFLEGGSREAEARFFHLTATRALGEIPAYLTLARKLVADHPTSDWAAETLNNLASHYILVDNDAEADLVFRDLIRLFPRHRHAERAAWRSGWWAYRAGNFADAVRIFEQGAANFPRSDYRPAWLYWSARGRDQLGDALLAVARYRLVVVDYQNSYYGRLATSVLERRRELPVQVMLVVDRQGRDGEALPSEQTLRALVAAGMYDDAVREIQYAQRVWGDSSALQATFAWIRHQQGLELKATDRFNALRGAINTMRRAYPQFMAAGGEERLPPDLLRIIFPLDYWPLIKKYSDHHGLDPYLIAALMAQESTFTAEIRSHANAYGLMQLIPGTGRRVAQKLGIRFTTASLRNPETNVRLGTQYFKDLLTRFGGAHFALASYNAGEHRVARWLKETPDLAQDEFIDNIPFPETQTYVKRILGTAEDYRRLYDGGVLAPAPRPGPTRSTD